MEIEVEKLYKLSEVSDLTGIPHSTLRIYARTGELKTSRIGKLWRVRGADVLTLVRGKDEKIPQEKEETFPEPPEDVYSVECAAFDLIKKLIGREPTDEERAEMLDFIRLFMRVSRTVPDKDIDKYADFEH